MEILDELVMKEINTDMDYVNVSSRIEILFASYFSLLCLESLSMIMKEN